MREVIESHKPDQLVISDSTLRPSVWPEPIFMKMAFKKGFSILAGSDTLPFSGDEKYMGTYASLIEGQFDAKDPVKSIRRMLRQSGHIARVGKRCGLIETIYRLANNAKTRKLAHNF